MDKKDPNDDLDLKMYLNDIEKCKPISKEEEYLLFAQFRKGDRTAFDRIVRSQLPFVVSVAKRYKFLCTPPVHFMDLIQAGNEGLLEAVEKFELSGNRLNSYAFWWIRQKILRLLSEQLPLIRAPNQIYQLSLKFRKLSEKKGRELTVKELARSEQVSPETAKDAILFEKIGKEHASLDLEVKGKNGEPVPFGSLLEVFVSEECTPEGSMSREEKSSEIEQFVRSLFIGEKKRTVEIIKLRTGLDDIAGDGMTFEAIGGRYSITRERVRQIVENFFKRKERRLKKFREEFLNGR